MKCIECPDYRECHKENDLRKKRHYCAKAKETHHSTNADRIRAMTDEELTEWLVMIERRIIENALSKPFNYTNEQLKTDWLNWLRKEAEND